MEDKLKKEFKELTKKYETDFCVSKEGDEYWFCVGVNKLLDKEGMRGKQVKCVKVKKLGDD